MTRKLEENKRTIIDRIDVVSLYLSRNMDTATFTRLYNAGDINRMMREDTGPIEAEDLDRWADICAGVAEGGALVDSLNRYIEALEGNVANQTEIIGELRERLESILSK
ncbi:MAG: hypothetical protein LBI67_12200 [Treponema sp.]|jgi:hypothetical protein|nr:hypothetical protein [Treponema sp.]